MKYIYFILIFFLVQILNGQSVSLTVVDFESGEPLSLANIVVKRNSNIVKGRATDFSGQVLINLFQSGTYDIETSFIGYKTQIHKGIEVFECDTTKLLVKLHEENQELEDVIVEWYCPIIDPDKTGYCITSSSSTSHACFGVSNSKRFYYTTLKKEFNPIFGSIDLSSMSSGQIVYLTEYEKSIGFFKNESYSKLEENAFLDSRFNPVSTFSIDVDRASYTNVRRFIDNEEKPPKDAVRIEEMINYFDYDYPKPKQDLFEVYTELSQSPWNKSNQLLHIGLVSKTVELDQTLPSNFVFLIDVSGSMKDDNKLPLVKETLKMITNKMRKEDQVSIVVYAGEAGCTLKSTSGENKTEILNAVTKLEAEGSTAGGKGIELAYKIALEQFIEGGNNRIILATDGDFNVGISSNLSLEKLIEEKRKLNIYITVLGYGMGNYKDDKLELLANKGNGNYAYIDHIDEAKDFLVNGFYSALYTVAKDVKLQLEFNPKYVKSYRLIGYENRMLANTDFIDDMKDAGEIGGGQSVTALYEIIPVKVVPKTILKYQKIRVSRDLCNLKIRYKEPDKVKSIELIKSIPKKLIPLDQTSDRFRFSAAVAMFGHILRESKFQNGAICKDVIALAKASKIDDDNGYKGEFIRLVRTYKNSIQTVSDNSK